MRKQLVTRGLLALVLGIGCLGPSRGRAAAQLPPPDALTDPDVKDGEGLQLLTRGPIHEAFAEPVVFDPKPGPIVPKEPPPPVEEDPPAAKPEGENVVWIPGYWAWDDQRNDFLWISGLWRDVPPGRQWMPGYWSEVEGGFQWTPGFWASTDQAQLEYLPAPPESLEAGPSGPPPSADAIWTPGTWVWRENRYVWQPGSWVDFQPDWVWVPSQYVWTPSGYLFNDGYWDRPMAQRGQAFAPVYFQQPLYRQPGYRLTPGLGLVASALASSLFVRPAYHQYYFGDYYDANNFRSGIYPWYSFHQSRYGYDPLFAQYSRLQARRNPGWLNTLHEDYRHRREHPEARPPQTYAQLLSSIEGNGQGQPGNAREARNLILTRPIRQLMTNPDHPTRFEQLDDARRKEFAQRSAQIQQFREQRLKREIATARGHQPSDAARAPRHIELPRSPIVARPHDAPNQVGAARARGPNPPPRPRVPSLDPDARPVPENQVTQRRFEPDPDRLPREVLRPRIEAGGPPDGGPPGSPASKAARPKGQPRLDRPKEAGPPIRSQPAPKIQTPAKKAEVPAKKAEVPAKKLEVPAKKAGAPAKKAGAPAKKASKPD